MLLNFIKCVNRLVLRLMSFGETCYPISGHLFKFFQIFNKPIPCPILQLSECTSFLSLSLFKRLTAN